MRELASAKRSHNAHKGSIRDNGRSYVVETDGGAAYLRNRRYIKAYTATARRNVVGASIAAVDKVALGDNQFFKKMNNFFE